MRDRAGGGPASAKRAAAPINARGTIWVREEEGEERMRGRRREVERGGGRGRTRKKCNFTTNATH